MKTLVAAVCAVAACTALAKEWRIGALAPTELADTEVSTNVPIALDSRGLRNFRFTLDFVSTPSNNVQAAFGLDTDSDGVLSAAETDLVFGWDCGRWFLMDTNGMTVATSDAMTDEAEKSLSWDLRLSFKRPQRLMLTENSHSLFPEYERAPEAWFVNRSWNRVRLTARGMGIASPVFWAEAHDEGFIAILR